MKNSTIYTFLVIVSTILFPLATEASQIYFGANQRELQVDQTFEIGVFLHTEGESINAIEGNIHFPADTVELQGIENGGSVVTLWVAAPKSENGTVSFSGIMPGGFSGTKGHLFSLIFTARKEESVELRASDEKILLNDGTGSEASVTKAPLTLIVIQPSQSQAPPEPFLPLIDTTPPEPFQLYVARNEHVFSNQWFVAFVSQDKSSGIDHYEVLERPQPASIFSLPFLRKEEWQDAHSPYLLQDQSLQSVILVKAVDKSGNDRTEVLAAPHPLAWYKNFTIWLIISIIVVLLLIFFFLRKILWKNPLPFQSNNS